MSILCRYRRGSAALTSISKLVITAMARSPHDPEGRMIPDLDLAYRLAKE